MKLNDKISGQGAILLCAVLWSTSGLFIKLISWHPMVIVGTRSFISVLVLLFIRSKINKVKFEKPKNILPLLIGGFFYMATMILFVHANKLTFAANAIMLQYAAPIWACLLGWYYLKEKPFWEHWFALGLVCVGMYLFFGNSLGGGSLLGDLLGMLSGVTFAANLIVLRKYRNENPLDIMICAHMMTFVCAIPFYFLHGMEMNTADIISILYMGILQIGIPSAIYVYGVKRISAVQVMLTASIEPILSPVWVLLVTGERPGYIAFAGGAVIIFAVVISSIITKRRENQNISIASP